MVATTPMETSMMSGLLRSLSGIAHMPVHHERRLQLATRCSAGSLRLFVFLLLSFVFTSAAAGTHAIIVNGLGGNQSFSESFAESAATIAAAMQSLDLEDSLIVQLNESAGREAILAEIAAASQRLDATDGSLFALVLIGHGTVDSNGWKFNIAGPDITTDDLVAALNAVPGSRQLVVLAASASGAALDALAQPGRVVVTATKSGGEINAVRFPEYLAEAVSSDNADYDRNEIVTVAEAFRFAQAKTTEYYEQQKLLASEHSRLRGDQANDIPLALLGSLKDASKDPTVAALLNQRLQLEAAFTALKQRKEDMRRENYYAELETLLISIARLQQSIDSATGWSGGDTDAES